MCCIVPVPVFSGQRIFLQQAKAAYLLCKFVMYLIHALKQSKPASARCLLDLTFSNKSDTFSAGFREVSIAQSVNHLDFETLRRKL